jgi:hypothetical protein
MEGSSDREDHLIAHLIIIEEAVHDLNELQGNLGLLS